MSSEDETAGADVLGSGKDFDDLTDARLGRKDPRKAKLVLDFIALEIAVEGILAARLAAVEALADEWEHTNWDAEPHLGCLDMRRYCAGLIRAALGSDATGATA